MQLSRWVAAFVFTQIIEMPIYAWALRERVRHPAARAAAAFGPSALTHPVVWFVIPHLIAHPYLAYLAVAETFAVVVEAIYVRAFGVRRALLCSLAANGASVAMAMITRRLFHFP
jgi:hypothetical protein